MKQYRITVNGQTYDVEVEEVGQGAGRSAAPSRALQQAVAAPVQTAPASVVAERAVPVSTPPTTPSQAVNAVSRSEVPSKPQPASGNAQIIRSPMPGTVLSFKVTEGQRVKRGDVLLVLEAMKMENDIVAPQDGTVVSLRVSASASVNTGDPLVDIVYGN